MSDTALAEAPGLSDNHAPPEAPAETAEALTPDEVFAKVAAEMGHSPKDKWHGDPDKWIDPLTFLKNTPKVVKSLKEQLERNAKVASKAIEDSRAAAVAQAKREIAEAARAGDEAAAEEATQKLERAHTKTDPALQDFAERNTWYTVDDAATQVAIAAAEKVFKSGGSVAEQCAAGEKEVRKRFPELFDDVEADPPPRRQPPSVEGGQRTAAPSARKKGWNDMPASAREANEKAFVRKKLLSREECAEAYWQENA